MRPVLQPDNIYAHRHEEQDVILWYNRALWHSIVSTLERNAEIVVKDTRLIWIFTDRVSQVVRTKGHASM